MTGSPRAGVPATDVDPGITSNETTVPMLPCFSVEDTIEFYEALGFAVTYKMTRPYLYLAFGFSGFELHFVAAPAGLDPAKEKSGGCLVMVDAVAPYHQGFRAALRARYGKVLASGRPRMTRFRPGQTRFTLIDPSGNSVIFIQRDEPEELEYGGSRSLSGLARAIDNARILRDFKNDDRTAARVLDVGLTRHGAQAPPRTGSVPSRRDPRSRSRWATLRAPPRSAARWPPSRSRMRIGPISPRSWPPLIAWSSGWPRTDDLKLAFVQRIRVVAWPRGLRPSSTAEWTRDGWRPPAQPPRWEASRGGAGCERM